ncbi:MAG: hypothetical protein AAF670_19665 [Planctomycetota bacterium]
MEKATGIKTTNSMTAILISIAPRRADAGLRRFDRVITHFRFARLAAVGRAFIGFNWMVKAR